MKKDFFEALMDTPMDDGRLDGVIADDTAAPKKESAFQPVTEAEVASMKTLLTKMAVAEDIPGAVNRDALVEAKNKKITRIPVCKVSAGKEYYRVNPDKNYWRLNLRAIIDEKSSNSGVYLISPDVELPASIRSEVKLVNLYTAMTATRDVFLLYVKHSNTDWYASAYEKVKLATRIWIKVEANTRVKDGGYDYYPSHARLADPVWVDLPPFEELMTLAFKNKIIENDQHPVILRLLGIEPDDSALQDDGSL